MEQKIKVAVIGLDTSHSVEFPKLIQDPATPEAFRVPELAVTRCLRFETPFQKKEGLDRRQEYLESIGVRVTENFDEAVADCSAILIEINDPSRHLEFFEKCASLGKPLFLDKPFADTLENTQRIMAAAKRSGTRFFTASALRFDKDLEDGLAENTVPEAVTVWGPLGKAPAGSSIVWYGVHTFEILQRIMGCGAVAVHTLKDPHGIVCRVLYADGRHGIVELTEGVYRYGTLIRDHKQREQLIQVTGRVPFYFMLLKQIVRFLEAGEQPVPLTDSLEIMKMLAAAERSLASGREETL